ncbi:hypothetical protein MVES_001870 [Malassezia vespertilionis]|uniref:N-acetyltransferase domain-containing protein n=1 Tax=Malassezia vespertilionis TaxID=2020962 RepID=A0A2N1JBM3_9BASI|nr:hypothetical protein MVES_001870 [Malassezia vespertilionis]
MAKVSQPELKRFLDRHISVNIQGGRKVQGTLRGYDLFLNLVVDNAVECLLVDKNQDSWESGPNCGTVIQGLAEYEKAPEQVQATEESIVHSIFEKKFAHALIAECEDSEIKLHPIGFAVYYYAYSTWTSRPTLFLEDLFVLPEYRNLGVGKRLFKHLGDIAHKEDCARVEWNVLTWNATLSAMGGTIGAVDTSAIPGGNGGYELHQKLRTKTVRLLKKQKYDEAIATLYEGSIKLLEMNEQGSGCDLAVYLLEVYDQANIKNDSASLDRIVSILGKTTAEFWRKKVISAAVKWTCAAQGDALGDAKLRLYIAELLAKDKLYYDAEAQFIAACAQSAEGVGAFAAMMKAWNEEYSSAMAKSDPHSPPESSVERVLAGTFAMRGWIPLLVAKAAENAYLFLRTFVTLVTERNPSLLLSVKPNPKEYQSSAPVSTCKGEMYVTGNPVLNFGQNAVLLACDASQQTGGVPDQLKGAWQQLTRQFMQENNAAVGGYIFEFLSKISSTYFGLAPARPQVDMLSNMMSSIMGGGGASSDGAKQAQPASIKQLPKPADTSSFKPLEAGGQSEADELLDDEMD